MAGKLIPIYKSLPRKHAVNDYLLKMRYENKIQTSHAGRRRVSFCDLLGGQQ